MKLLKATLKDCNILQEICKESYSQNFYSHWIDNGLETFLEKEFNLKKIISDLKNRNIKFYFIIYKSEVIGFAKISFNVDFFSLQNVAELDKIYVLPAYKNLGIGKFAIAELIKIIKKRSMKKLYLCVLETNISAIRFYEKMGFVFHSKTRIRAQNIKDEHKGMNVMLKVL